MPVKLTCSFCNKAVVRRNGCRVAFCDTRCKAEWQKLQRPVTVEWLRVKYIDEGLDCTKIAKMVKRNPKAVWSWLIGSGIPTRKRGKTGNGANNVGYWRGKNLTQETRAKLSASHKARGSCPALVNGVHWLHFYKDRKPASWRGGISPERQAFYGSKEWKSVAPKVWARDKKTCQRCGKKHAAGNPFDIHHIVSFEIRELRAELSNLVLLCEQCHYWCHSPKNTKNLFIKTHANTSPRNSA